jgi:hypothetical protein
MLTNSQWIVERCGRHTDFMTPAYCRASCLGDRSDFRESRMMTPATGQCELAGSHWKGDFAVRLSDQGKQPCQTSGRQGEQPECSHDASFRDALKHEVMMQRTAPQHSPSGQSE